MSKCHNILPTKDSFFFQVPQKLRVRGNSKSSFSSSCFIAGDSYRKMISSYTAVFNENTTLCFSDIVHLLKYFPIKVPKNYFD